MSCNSLSVMEAKLPPGFRFHPRDDELICDYLMKKITLHSSDCYCPLLIEVDLNKCEPWDIPEIACVGGKEWYFYSQRDRKYATGLRTNRATISGYWKATGKDRPVVKKGSLVGMRKTLVFYEGRAPKGRKTNWVMHEFRLEGPFGPPKTTSSKEDWVLCRVFNKNREVSPPPGSAAAAAPIANKPSSMESNNSYEESGSSSLPGLMDSYITFDQNTPYYPHHQQQQSTMNNSNPTVPPTDNNAYQQVPCFSIFSTINNNNNNNMVNQTDPALPAAPTYLDQLQEQNNMTMSSDHPADHKIAAPIFPAAAANQFHDAGGGGGNITINPLSCDRHVIKAVLNHLTKMNNNNNNHQDAAGCSPNIRGRSSPSFGEAASSSAESYLSDVANLPTVSMWTNNY